MKKSSCSKRFIDHTARLLNNQRAWGKLSEYDVRDTYVLPMFKQLGWNIDNKGLTPFDFEVLRESTIKSGRPDITLRLHGNSIFYIETKSLKVQLNEKNVLQVWRYAWSSGHPFSMLTNFLESWLIDCRATPPTQKDATTASQQVLFRWHASTLAKQWSDISSLLGRSAVNNGALDELEDALVKKTGKVRGVELTLFPMQGSHPVDKHFLSQLDEWRLRLVRNIYASHPKWDCSSIIEVADQVLNLIVFTRILEDQGLEPRFPLQEALKLAARKPGTLWRELNHVREDLDQKYNGTVFKSLPRGLKIDEGVLADIIISISPPHTPYLLDFLPPDILGTIYERFLGAGISFAKGKVQIADAKTNRKAAGVFYTERYITNFMVSQTLSPILKGIDPPDLQTLRIADIACGSGSFLIAVFKCLSAWLEHKCLESDEWKEEYLERLNDGTWKLSLQKKLDILKNCIYGVDIDSEAVNVTKFSLYLQALAGETPSRIKGLWNRKRRPILPVLDRNIQSGNSLVRYDIVEDLVGSAELKRQINPFNLKESFTEVFDEGGFSVILGNPPYNAKLEKPVKEYCKQYPLSSGNFNTANLFIDRTAQLLKKNGAWCLIVPKSLIYSDKWLTTRNHLRSSVNLALDASKAFKNVLLEQVIVGRAGTTRKLMTGSIQKHSRQLFDGIRSVPFTDILPANITKEEIAVGKSIAKTTDPMSKHFLLKRGNVPLSSLRPTGDVKVLQGRYVQGYTIVEPDRGISEEEMLDIHERRPEYDLLKIVAQQIVSHSMKPYPHIRFVGMLDEWGILSVDTVSNIIPRALPAGGKASRDFMLLALGVFNSRITSWFADRFVYAKAIRTMHLDNIHLSKLRFPKKKLLGTVEAKCIINQVSERLSLRPGVTDGDKDIYFRDCETLEREIDKSVAKLLGLSMKKLSLINEVFGDECLAKMGLAGRSSSVMTPPKSRKRNRNQLQLWE